MVVFVGGEILVIAALFIFVMTAGSAYVLVEFLYNNWMYFVLASAVMLIIKTIAAAVKSYEKWHAILFFVLDVIRIALTYITFIWFASDWLLEMENSFITFFIRCAVEGIVVLAVVGWSVISSWCVFVNDEASEDFSWLWPLLGIVGVIILLGIRMLIEYANTGVFFPTEMFLNILSEIK